MNIITEKREVIGIVKTGMGMFYQLGKPGETRRLHIGSYAECYQFHVIDEEGFENYVWVNGPFTVTPLIVPEIRDVKVVLTDEEAAQLDRAELFSDEPISK